MSENPHLAPAVVRFGAPLSSARVAAILVHGRMQSPGDMAEHVVRRLALPDVAYLAPEADGRTWYPKGFLLPVEENQPRLDFALTRLAALSDELAAQGWPRERQVLLGFSQGACLLCELVYRQRWRLGALIAFTGGLIGPPGTRWPDEGDAFAGMPVLLGGSADDPWVPASRMEETAALFRRLGATVELALYPGNDHLVRDEQIAAARALLAALPGR